MFYVYIVQILKNRYEHGWKVSKPKLFKFKSDRITATLEKNRHVHGDWRAAFIGPSEVCMLIYIEIILKTLGTSAS